MLRVGLQGCVHGDLSRCYGALGASEVDCVVWSGDVQCLRSEADFSSLACPDKYKALKDFQAYYQLRKAAPVLTVFVGGNHENSNLLNALPYGGWVAPNIYYMGRSGCVSIRKGAASGRDGAQSCGGETLLRLAGLSGIFDGRDYNRGYFEKEPFDWNTVRSVYHVREHDLVKLSMLSQADLVLTHDWPADLVTRPEDRSRLLQRKPFFQKDLDAHRLGNPHLHRLLALQPAVWAAAHLHVNFSCPYGNSQFISHDKPKKLVATSIWNTTEGLVSTPNGPLKVRPLGLSSRPQRYVGSGHADPGYAGPEYAGQGHMNQPATNSQSGINRRHEIPPWYHQKDDNQNDRDKKRQRTTRPSYNVNDTRINDTRINDALPNNQCAILIDLEWFVIQRRTVPITHMHRSPAPALDPDSLASPVTRYELEPIINAISTKIRPCWTINDIFNPSENMVPLASLRSFTIPYPQFDHTRPHEQTAWWLSIFMVDVATPTVSSSGIESPVEKLPQIKRSPPSFLEPVSCSGLRNPLLDEEESLSLDEQ
ncbi:putative lariat debranching enzyme [Gregarina niphandrodes]|uniref:Lariat debranching enzyme n=1 Tax=Gregarina niphandrodes TaxID=110365 RepID=A0A023B160_GRENI|nr:putative lariat debranching enzyme [Gregarina niphandrodes]EZG46243.1 putative lariat debranching enzyme [Gregarina niphandrodes]|eukprot:XP_011132313.1 putative lariat debranching enzyme [Gregarina niphandrodes]